MKFLFLLPIFLVVALYFLMGLHKNHQSTAKLKSMLLKFAIFCCVLSILAVIVSVYFSGDKTQLFKISLPALVLVITFLQLKEQSIK